MFQAFLIWKWQFGVVFHSIRYLKIYKIYRTINFSTIKFKTQRFQFCKLLSQMRILTVVKLKFNRITTIIKIVLYQFYNFSLNKIQDHSKLTFWNFTFWNFDWIISTQFFDTFTFSKLRSDRLTSILGIVEVVNSDILKITISTQFSCNNQWFVNSEIQFWRWTVDITA